jgi:HEAT repeat protein
MRYLRAGSVILGLSMAVAAAAAVAAETTVPQLVASLKSNDEAARATAADQLAAAGAKAQSAVPALTEALHDVSPVVRVHAAHALGQMGEAAKPAVLELMKLVGDRDPAVRRQASAALRQLRPGPKVTVPLFAKLMADADPGVRTRAMNALAEAGEEAVPFLIAALKNEKSAYWACLVLRDLGPQSKAAVPALAKLVTDQHVEVRREAILALAAIGPAAAPASANIVPALDDTLTCAAAVYALGCIGNVSDEAEAKIRKHALDDPDKIVRVASIWATAKLHFDSKQYLRRATQALAKMLKDPEPRVRAAAANALAVLNPGPDITLPVMEEVLRDADEKVVAAALDAIAGLGAPAVPKLVVALKYPRARARVAYILGQMGAAAAPAVDALAGLIDDKDPRTQEEALMALAKIGPAAKGAVPALSKALQQRDAAGCYGIVYALGSIGPAAVAAQPALLKVLGSDDDSIALIGAWALVRIEAGNPECLAKCVPVLIRGLSSAAVPYRLAAAETLAALGPLAKPAVPALKQALKDEDQTVSTAAAAALRAIQKSLP